MVKPPYATGAMPLMREAAGAHPPLGITPLEAPPPKVSFRPFANPIQNQGAENTCVGHAVAKANEVVTAILFGSCPLLSRLGVFNNAVARDGLASWRIANPNAGTYVWAAAKGVMEAGVCLEADYPYDVAACYQPIPASVRQNPEYFIDAYQVGFGTETAKNALASGKPCVAVIECDETFFFPQPSQVIHPGTAVQEYHAVPLLGYDDSRQAFEVANSWGVFWGDGGWCWLGYDYIDARGADITTFTPNLTKKLAGDANADTRVNASDVLIALGGVVGTRRITAEARAVLDLNADHKLTVSDVISLLRKTVAG